MVREVITVHIGQAGCQVGKNIWELFCLEHNIDPSGRAVDDSSPGVADSPHNAFFSETSSGQHVPRAIFLDTDPSSREEILVHKYRRLFHPEYLIGYHKDCKNNFFEGRSQWHELHIKDDVMDRIRMAADLCSNLQGFFVFHAFGGGTGAGIGSEFLTALHSEFDKKEIFQPSIFPSRHFSNCAVEPYNSMFCTNATRDTVHLSLMMDNQAAYNICQKNLKIAKPHFTHINRIIAQMVSACTTSLRYEAELNASLNEITTNLVPTKVFRYPVVSMSPMRAADMKAHENFSTTEIINELFESKSVLCDCTQYLKSNRYLAAVVLLRGVDKAPAGADATVDDGGSVASGASGSRKGIKQPAIQFNEVMGALHLMMNPKGAYRQPLRFLPWMSSGGFKVGIVGQPPFIPRDFMAQTDRQGVLLGNTTAVRQLFVRQYTKFLKLLFHKAYIWQFLEANGEMDEFYEARINIRALIDEYESLLKQCVEQENDGSDARVQLRGETPSSS